jgi:MoxR-like ATPase
VQRHDACQVNVHASILQVSTGGLADLLTMAGSPASNSSKAPSTSDAAAAGDSGVGASAASLTMDAVRSFRASALQAVTVPRHVIDILVDLRTHMQEQLEPPAYISDRRLVKAVDLMKACILSSCPCHLRA